MRPPPTAQAPGPPPLTCIALEALAGSISKQATLCGSSGSTLPEELCDALFQRVIEQGRLTPKVLDLFERTQHEAVTERVAALGIRRWTPPLLPTTRDGPLGFSKPAWQ